MDLPLRTAAAALVLLAGCAPAGPSGSSTALDAATGSAIDSIAAEALEAGPVAGLSIAVVRDGRVVYARGHGSADMAAGRATTHETVYVAASVTKMLTSLAALTLVRDGRLDLGGTLGELLPSHPIPEWAQGVTLRQMLDHTSGLPDLVRDAQDRWLATGQPLEPAWVLEWLRFRRLDFEPGTRWSYSNTGFYLVGLIIEATSGRPYGDYVREAVALPLGLDDTFLCDDGLLPERRTVGYEPGDDGLTVSSNYETTGVKTGFGAAGGFCSTAVDLASLPQALAESQLLPDALLTLFRSPTTLADGATVDYGLGVRLGSLDGHALWGHTGGSSSTWAVVAHYPESSTTVATMVNTDGARPDAWMLEGRVARRVLGLPDASIDSVVVSDLGRYEGRYVGGRGNRQFEISAEGARLRIRELGRDGFPTDLTPVGEHRFALSNRPMDHVVFEVRDGVVLGYSIYWDGIFWESRRAVR